MKGYNQNVAFACLFASLEEVASDFDDRRTTANLHSIGSAAACSARRRGPATADELGGER